VCVRECESVCVRECESEGVRECVCVCVFMWFLMTQICIMTRV